MYEITAAVDHMFITRPHSLRSYLLAVGVNRLDYGGKVYWISSPYIEAKEYFITRSSMRGEFSDIDARWLSLKSLQEITAFFGEVYQQLPKLVQQLDEEYDPFKVVIGSNFCPTAESLVFLLLKEQGYYDKTGEKWIKKLKLQV